MQKLSKRALWNSIVFSQNSITITIFCDYRGLCITIITIICRQTSITVLDCDGSLTADDCDDGDAESTIIAEDGDCDGVLTEDDCDDSDEETVLDMDWICDVEKILAL